MRSPLRGAARGFTLVEVMFASAILLFVIGGAILFMIAQTQSQRRTYDKTDIQRSGRMALGALVGELAKTGLGLPATLAIKSFANPGTAAPSCNSTPVLTVASLDLRREWTISGISASAITLASATPTGAADVALANDDWMFVFQNSADGGHGLVQLSANRAATSATIAYDVTNYSTAQPSLNLTTAAFNGGGTGHPVVGLRAEVSAFGVNCTDANHPYLYWQRGGRLDVLAANVDTRALAAADESIDAASGDVVGLRFRFLVDDDFDTQPDDVDGSGLIDTGDLVVAPANLANIVAVEVMLRLRSDTPNATTGRYDFMDFTQLVQLSNLHPAAPGTAQYIFVDNTAFDTSP